MFANRNDEESQLATAAQTSSNHSDVAASSSATSSLNQPTGEKKPTASSFRKHSIDSAARSIE